MQTHTEQDFRDTDTTAAERKREHIELALRSQLSAAVRDARFLYEPLLAAHPSGENAPFSFLGKEQRLPFWVSSMTGGTALARSINERLARVGKAFGFGMGLGSCRSLLTDDAYLADFDVRAFLGDDLPLYANLGIAQIERLLRSGETYRIAVMLDKLRADGLIIHVNPMQEWLQPEGDRFTQPPLQTICQLLDAQPNLRYIVKEVGQGMGPASLEALLRLPLQAVEFAAYGGTNFAKVELLRSDAKTAQNYENLAKIGHTAEEMVEFTNAAAARLQAENALNCREIIISGGVRDFLDGYYLTNKLSLPSVYGQASAFLQYARTSYDELEQFVATQAAALEFARAYLRVR